MNRPATLHHPPAVLLARRHAAEPIHLLDERIVRLSRDGRLRTAAQLAQALGADPSTVDDALRRLLIRRRVLRAGHTPPTGCGYAVPWPTLWGLEGRNRR